MSKFYSLFPAFSTQDDIVIYDVHKPQLLVLK